MKTCICGLEHEPFFIDGQEIENVRAIQECRDAWLRESEGSGL